MGNGLKTLRILVEQKRDKYVNEKESLFHLGLTQAYADVLDIIDELGEEE